MGAILKLVRDNRYVYLRGELSKRAAKIIDDATSYKVQGYFWSAAFKSKVWDGKEHLFKFSVRRGDYRAPAGCFDDIVEALDSAGVRHEVEDIRKPPPVVDYTWNGEVEPRPYQKQAAVSIKRHGYGIVKMPIRSGKTKTAAVICMLLKTTALFIVPSAMLLEQTVKSLQECFQDHVGSCQMIGPAPKPGEPDNRKRDWNPNGVNVVTIQMLGYLKRTKDPLYYKITHGCGLAVFDECHHLTASEWRDIMMEINAYYRVGLSATAFPEDHREQERGVIWLKACCGPIRIDIPTSELIEGGFLIAPTIHLYRVRSPDGLQTWGWSKRLADECIWENVQRNGAICRIARAHARDGLRVLIVSRRKEQVAALMAELGERQANFIVGGVMKSTRAKRVREFVERKRPILVGTVFGEGVDIPEIDVVINAEGGRDIKATVQRLRNLTPSAGKTDAIVVDFMDLTNPYFTKHARERLAVYKSEAAFKFKIMDEVI